MSTASKGHGRERQIKKLLEEQGWIVFRAPASLGVCDLIALKAGERPRMIEVKANELGGPWSNFRWRDRADLLEAAMVAGAEAWLCHVVSRREPVWIHQSQWPEGKAGLLEGLVA